MKKSIFVAIFLLSGISPIFAQHLRHATILPHQIDLTFVPVAGVNSVHSWVEEREPVLTADAKTMYFASDRGGQMWSHFRVDLKRWDEDIFFSHRLGPRSWSEPLANPIINSKNDEQSPQISSDGQVLYFESFKDFWDTQIGPFYYSILDGSEWGTPKAFNSPVSQFLRDFGKQFWSRGYTISRDGKAMIFSVQFPPKGFHLYISRNNGSEWSAPKLLSVNTDSSEGTPFLAADNHSLYFSSNGYEGFGGYDIYRTHLFDNDSCGEVFNLGPDFNSTGDDRSITFTSKADEVYKVLDGRILMSPLPIIHRASPELASLVSGIISDQNSKSPLHATLTLKRGDSVIMRFESNKSDGQYQSLIDPQQHYHLTVESPNYVTSSIDLYSESGADLKRDIFLKPFGSNVQVAHLDTVPISSPSIVSTEDTINPIHFPYGHTQVGPESFPDLNRAVSLIKTNKIDHVELDGHTDSVGSKKFNKHLSFLRAISVKKYLCDRGIGPESIAVIAHGSEMPLASNETKEGRKTNRCVEIRFQH